MTNTEYPLQLAEMIRQVEYKKTITVANTEMIGRVEYKKTITVTNTKQNNRAKFVL